MNSLPDRSGDRPSFQHASDKKTGAAWQDTTHGSAHDKATAFQNSWMNTPAHRDAYQHHVWSPPAEGEQFPSPSSMRTFNSIRPSIEKGVPGIVAGSNAGNEFIPNQQIGSLSHSEREGVDQSAIRQEKYDRNRPSYRNDVD